MAACDRARDEGALEGLRLRRTVAPSPSRRHRRPRIARPTRRRRCVSATMTESTESPQWWGAHEVPEEGLTLQIGALVLLVQRDPREWHLAHRRDGTLGDEAAVISQGADFDASPLAGERRVLVRDAGARTRRVHDHARCATRRRVDPNAGAPGACEPPPRGPHRSPRRECSSARRHRRTAWRRSDSRRGDILRSSSARWRGSNLAPAYRSHLRS